MQFLPLDRLGRRIVVCGPSNAGKSTLAHAIGRKIELPVVYLDLLRHIPNTDWEMKPDEEFEALHAEAVAGENWVMEGNYTSLIQPRLSRATGVVLLGSEPLRGLFRYVRRTLFEKQRAGMLEGGTDRLKWPMAHFIVFRQPQKHERDRTTLRSSGLPMVDLPSMRALERLYEAWGLER